MPDYRPSWQYQERVWDHKAEDYKISWVDMSDLLTAWLDGLDEDVCENAEAIDYNNQHLKWIFNLKSCKQYRLEFKDGEWWTISERVIRRVLLPM